MIDQEPVKHSLYENGYGLTVVEVGQLNYGGILRRSISSPHGYYDFGWQELHKTLDNSNLDPREIERARKGQVSLCFLKSK